MKSKAILIRTAASLLLVFAGGSAWPAPPEAVRPQEHPKAELRPAPLDKAEAAYEAGDYQQAARLFRAAAEKGDAAAQNRLGFMYTAGQGVARDDAQALAWYRKSAKAGLAKAQANLATLYFEGLGVERDYSQALAWYRKAAEQGLAFAQEKLGRMYQEGLGTPRDEAEAARWLAAARAAKAGEPAPQALEVNQEKAPSVFALLIGIEKYPDLPEARFAGRDAADVEKLLMRLGCPRQNIRLLLGRLATRENIEREVERWLPQVAGPDSTVLFYFAGLGAPDIETRQAYLIPWDGSDAFLASQDYSLRKLYSTLAGLKARRVIVALDAGFSGFAGRSVIAAGAAPVRPKVAPRTPSEKLIVFTASSEEGGADVLEECGHGLFTCHFLEGLGGRALDSSGTITAGGLYDYLRPLVAAHPLSREEPQTPMLFGARDALILGTRIAPASTAP